MKNEKLKYVYGPVASWRLGLSLGVDPLSGEKKNCPFDCAYCQIGRAVPCVRCRKIFMSTKSILDELRKIPAKTKIDYITFSGMGEPTLAKNFGELIRKIRKIRKEPIAVITNSSLIDNSQVRKELKLADLVMAKLDACGPDILRKINNPAGSVKFDKIVAGLKKFSKEYKGILALQIMFINANKKYAAQTAEIVKEIDPYEVQINTPLRKNPCKPLSKVEIDKIKKAFSGCKVITVYDKNQKISRPLNKKETLRRRARLY
ncbi:MAG: radical SAM protein [PVC group bacterium]|nr:radical SAM protein [PVC group bacterium]